MRIMRISAREVLDSRGNPTVEAKVFTRNFVAVAKAPSGASTGVYEALELRDGDRRRYGGKGVLKAVANVNNKVNKAFKNYDLKSLRDFDGKLIGIDGTEDKSRLGANATTAVSMAAAKAIAMEKGKPLYKSLNPGARVLPVPMFNVLNGGKHAGTNLSIQEFMVFPVGAKSFSGALRMGAETYHELGRIVKKKYGVSAKNVGDEGGYAPAIQETREALDSLEQAISNAGYSKKMRLCIDAAASSFYNEKTKRYFVDGKNIPRGKLIDFYSDLVREYPFASLEDPLEENDFEGFAELTREIGSKVQVVGDDLFVTNMKRLQEGIDLGACNALLLKVNQVGTMTEAIDAARLSFKSKYAVVVSHRSGETADTTIADLAVSLNCGQIKTGAPARSERVAKYNRLMEIETELGAKAVFAGRKFRRFG